MRNTIFLTHYLKISEGSRAKHLQWIKAFITDYTDTHTRSPYVHD